MSAEPEAFQLEAQTLEDIADQASQLARSTGAWPKNLAEMVDVAGSVLRRSGLTDERAEELARCIALAQARTVGGRPFYFPNGDALELALRDDEIYRAARRGNTEALARKYKLTPRSIERIVHNQTLLHRARMQPQLPLPPVD